MAAVALNGGYHLSNHAMYMEERIGVAVTSRSSRVQNANRLTQVIRLGVMGSHALTTSTGR